jgi:flagellar assembly protein FliH
MRIEPINFRDFAVDGAAGAVVRKPFLPGGRRKEEAPPPPPAPTFSEEQLKAAERDGYKNGFVEGTQEGIKQAESEQADVNRKLGETVEQFANSISPLLNDYHAMVIQLKKDLPRVALTIAKKAAGDALTENAAAAVESMALNAAQTMIGEPKIAVTVHTNLAAALEVKLKDLASRMQSATAFIVVGSDTIALADCRVEWKHGAMERHTGQLWAEIDKAVNALSEGAQRIADKHIETLAAQLPPETLSSKKE